MPELPEAEAVVRRLRRHAGKARIVAASVVRAKITAPQSVDHVESGVRDTAISRIHRRGKQVLIDLTSGLIIRIHLGMTGDVYVIEDYRLRPHTTRAWFRLENDRAIVFDDSRILGHLNLYGPDELAAALAHLGPEPLSRAFTPQVLSERAARCRLPIKVFLMDQTKIAGLGNIYAAESLFRAGIHPARPACKLRSVRIERLHDAIVNVLEDALQSACTAYMRPGRFREAEAFTAQVYGREREPCMKCQRKIRRIQQGGRSTYFCPGCQT
jgi:formamidopyrimidine-DNA glycosylase